MRIPACESWEAVTSASSTPRRDPGTRIQPAIATASETIQPAWNEPAACSGQDSGAGKRFRILDAS